jgi:hypothetical protein
VEERGERGRLHRVVQVRVGQHDQRVVPAEFEHAALEGAARPLGEDAAGRRGAGEVDALRVEVVEQLG